MPPRGPRGDWNRPPGNMHQGGFQGTINLFISHFRLNQTIKTQILMLYTLIPHAAYMRRGIYKAYCLFVMRVLPHKSKIKNRSY